MRAIFIIKYIFYTYFTYFPCLLYNYANNYGNLSMSGIGLGLIYSQRIYWIANIISFISLYLYNMNIYYVNILLFIICGYLYISSLLKTIYLIKLLDNISNS